LGIASGNHTFVRGIALVTTYASDLRLGNKNLKKKPWERLIPTDLVGIALGNKTLELSRELSWDSSGPGTPSLGT